MKRVILILLACASPLAYYAYKPSATTVASATSVADTLIEESRAVSYQDCFQRNCCPSRLHTLYGVDIVVTAGIPDDHIVVSQDLSSPPPALQEYSFVQTGPLGWFGTGGYSVIVPYGPYGPIVSCPEIPDSPIKPAVPEPSTWALLLAGLGLVGARVRSARHILR